ncbi:DUF2147 domain-containing protein [Emticicia aquatilis]|nr:DUF2147 domain-containing protein [Emticicia aquatilis]
MKTKQTIMMLSLMFIGTLTAFSQTKADAILGEWLSAKKDSRFLIYKQGNKYFGKVVWGTEVDKGIVAKDTKNPDPKLRNRDLLGLVLLKDFEFDMDDTWENGTIYDPREGKTYSCKMTLKNANQLDVRGFMGISLFGRSEIWTRYK